MHNNADEQFDQFVKKQLEQTEVDPALAQHYFDQMLLPPPPSPAGVTAAAKSGWWRFWTSMVVVSAAAVVIYKTTRPSAPPSAPQVQQPAASAADSGRQQPGMIDSTARLTPSVTAPPLPGAAKPVAAAPEALPVIAAPAAPVDSTFRPLPAPRVVMPQTDTKRKDSLPGALRPPTAIPKKQSDSAYIIWY